MYHNTEDEKGNILNCNIREPLVCPVLARFPYCLRVIVSIIAGQRSQRHATRNNATCRAFLSVCAQVLSDRREKCVSSPYKQLFPFVGEVQAKFSQQRNCFVLLHTHTCIYMHAANGIPRFTSRMIVHFDRFWQIQREWKRACIMVNRAEAFERFFSVRVGDKSRDEDFYGVASLYIEAEFAFAEK